MEQLKKIAKGLDAFLKIIFWLLVVMCAVAVVLAVVVLICEKQLLLQNNLSEMVITFSGVTYSWNDISNISFKQAFALMSALPVMAGVVVLYGIRVVRRILQPMKEGRPFDTAVSNNFRKLGWLSLIYGIVGVIIKVISRHLVLNLLSEMALQPGATLSTENIFDGTFILISILLFLFSYIFKYGEELQAQSDETL